jgi:hypothetical protein
MNKANYILQNTSGILDTDIIFASDYINRTLPSEDSRCNGVINVACKYAAANPDEFLETQFDVSIKREQAFLGRIMTLDGQTHQQVIYGVDKRIFIETLQRKRDRELPRFESGTSGYHYFRNAIDAASEVPSQVQAEKTFTVKLKLGKMFKNAKIAHLVNYIKRPGSQNDEAYFLECLLREKIAIKGNSIIAAHSKYNTALFALLGRHILPEWATALSAQNIAVLHYGDEVLFMADSHESATEMIAEIKNWFSVNLGIAEFAQMSVCFCDYIRFAAYGFNTEGSIIIPYRRDDWIVSRFKSASKRRTKELAQAKIQFLLGSTLCFYSRTTDSTQATRLTKRILHCLAARNRSWIALEVRNAIQSFPVSVWGDAVAQANNIIDSWEIK